MQARRLWMVAVALLSWPALAADYYVDPVNGDPGGDGSAGNPWRTIPEVIEAGLVESQEWESLPYEDGQVLVPKNPGAPVKPGDTLWLRSGYHGSLFIESHYNPDFITIAAEPGHSPQLARVHLRSSSHWVLRGLTVSPEFGPQFERAIMIELEAHGWRGPISDIVVEDCLAFTRADISGWTAADWDSLACNGVDADGTRMTIRANTLRNVNFGISVGASQSLIEGNLVENFSGDGLRGLGDYSTFQYNTIRNCYDVNDNHDDGFQSWSYGADGVGTGVVRGIVLRGNRIVNYTDPNQPLRGPLQGIGCFDGFFEDWVVENNVIVVDHWHGITLLGATNCRIINNTVLDVNTDSPGPPWVRIGTHKDGTASTGCIVRNNLTTAISIDAGQDVTADHNLIIDDQALLFVDPAEFDLHLLPDAPAVDTGSPDLAPATDIEGVPRPTGAGVDIGAHEYSEDPPDGGVDGGADGSLDGEDDGNVDGDADVPPDAGVADGSDAQPSDSGLEPDPGKVTGSCGCAAGDSAGGGLWLWLVVGLVVRRRRSTRPAALAS